MAFVRRISLILLLAGIAACSALPPLPNFQATPTAEPAIDIPLFFPTSVPTNAQAVLPIPAGPANKAGVPAFDHIIIFMLENKEYTNVIGNPKMPIFNQLAEQYTLLTQYHAVTHPSLPNYIALLGGDTFGITTDCKNCFVNEPSLPDLIEKNGRTWKSYQEDMPEPCHLGNAGNYVQRHNPFVYFDPIRLDAARCAQHDTNLVSLSDDIEALTFPNFMFIVPNNCNNAHNCGLDTTDEWLTDQLNALVPALNKTGDSYLIVLNWDEGQDNTSCCGLPAQAGGRIPVVLISPEVKNGFQDDTPYTHYSLLKTISAAWGLPYLGHAADQNNVLITAPWK